MNKCVVRVLVIQFVCVGAEFPQVRVFLYVCVCDVVVVTMCSCVCRMETHFSHLPLSSVTAA